MSSQVQCSFRVDRHGPLPLIPEQPAVVDNSNQSIQDCFAFAKPLIEQFQSGIIPDKQNLKRMRDEKYVIDMVPKPIATPGGVGRTRADRKVQQAAPNVLPKAVPKPVPKTATIPKKHKPAPEQEPQAASRQEPQAAVPQESGSSSSRMMTPTAPTMPMSMGEHVMILTDLASLGAIDRADVAEHVEKVWENDDDRESNAISD